jgi:protein-disulfide isomerase
VSRLRPPLDPRDHLRGDIGAQVQLVEFGDYECPFCQQAQASLRALEQLGDLLCFAFRNFPIVGAHPHARV